MEKLHTPEDKSDMKKGEPFPSAPDTKEVYGPETAIISQPPSAPPAEEPRGRRPLASLYAGVTEDEIREACFQYAAEDCCYGSKFVQQMAIREINNGYVYLYRLQSIGEKRQTYLEYTPYYGQPIDGPEFGPSPHPWDIPVAVPRQFTDTHYKQEVPHTAVVKTCFYCKGNRTVRCIYCYGSGTATCFSCDGTKEDSSGFRCSPCRGAGTQRCSNCSATGQVECQKCKARGQLKGCILMAVTWKCYEDSFTTSSGKVPKEMIEREGKSEIFREEGYKLWPVNHSPDASLNNASMRLIQKYDVQIPDQRIVKQMHTIQAVPLVTVKYEWKNRSDEFYLYGPQKKVYFESYPQPCCCCTCL